MPVPLDCTQPSASELLSYDGFVRRLETLKSSPRVMVQTPGYSHGGRGIHCILIADEEVVPQLDGYRALAAELQSPHMSHRTLFHLEEEKQSAVKDFKLPVLVTGLSFGHEAAHVEALLKLTERLAWTDDDRISEILDKLIVLVIPMMNPDGRMMAIETWTKYPLAADSSAGNRYGFYLNRDFVHLTQPETRAVLQVYREWKPVALLDTHEDVFILGVQVPEVCWCPGFGLSTVEEAPESIKRITQRLGGAIIEEWERSGFDYLKRDLFMWTKSGDAEEGPRYVANGNIVQAMAIHGIPSVITESARTPGTQTWEDRIGQKVSAGLALLTELASSLEDTVQVVFAERERVMTEAVEFQEAFILPKSQKEQGALLQLLNTLLLHGIQAYETDRPYEAFLVPLAQAEARMARELLSTRTSKLFAMPPALGLAVARYDSLSEEEQEALQEATLTPVTSLPPSTLSLYGQSQDMRYAIRNSTEGIKLVNRLLSVGATVDWLLEPQEASGQRLDRGTFVVEGVRFKALEIITQGLALDIHSLPVGELTAVHTLRRPRVALYVGQGVDGHDASARADLWYALDRLEMGFLAIEAQDIRDAFLEQYDVLIVPSGNAQEIVNGWGKESVPNSPPWELPGEPRGIGTEGLEAIRRFVDGGGTYFGVDGGGGVLALEDYADIIDLEVMAHTLGYARVLLRVDQPDHPLMFGLNGCYDDSGTWQEGFMPAYYQSDRFEGLAGGLVFHLREEATALASYHQVDHDTASRQVVEESFLTHEKQGVAIAYQKKGRGHVVVAGVRPGFRAVWSNTWKLISNAVFLSVAEERAE